VPERPILLLDSASLYYRAFYALPESMTAPDGRPHNAIRGFLATVTRLIDIHSPVAVLPCWDEDWRPEWRVELIPSYKAHRLAEPLGDAGAAEAEPESLGEQAVAIAEILTLAGIAPVGREGYEADDAIASLAAQHSGPVVAVSGDRDLVQVVDASTALLLTINGGMDKWPLLDPAAVLERFGVRPDQYVDLAVLRGDPSDGLPGVKGIGAKTAVALVTAFDDVGGILRAAAERPSERPMTPRLAGLLLDSADLIDRAKTVATAVTDLDLDLDRAMANRGRLDELAAQWGVERQVKAMLTSLDRHTADE
jgi:5'-3' exonuclease